MSRRDLTLDPQIQTEYEEPPYDEKRDEVYAPAEPFAAAIDEWLRLYQKRAGTTQFSGITMRNGRKATVFDRGISALEQRTGISSRTLRTYLNGERRWIALGNADKLAIGLGVPLCLLAEEFVPKGRTTMRTGKGQKRKAA